MYSKPNYSGQIYKNGTPKPGAYWCELSSLPHGHDAASVYNNTTHISYYWTGEGFTGSRVNVAAQSGIAKLPSPFYKNLGSWRGYCSDL